MFGNKTGATGFSFGANNNASASTPAFGSNNNTTSGGFGFGANNNNNNATTGGNLFGSKPPGGTGGFGFGASNQSDNNSNIQNAAPGGFSFGTNNNNNNNNTQTGNLFGNNTSTNIGATSFNNNSNNNSTFGNNAGATGNAGGLFGGSTNNNSTTVGNAFGTKSATATGGGLFGGAPSANGGTSMSSGLFGSKPNGTLGSAAGTTGSSMLGQNNAIAPASAGGLFGTKPSTGTTLFANTGTSANGAVGGNAFGNNTTTSTSGGLFGNNNSANTGLSGGLFGAKPTGPANTSLFGNNNSSSQFSFGTKPAASTNGNTLLGNNNVSGGLFGQQPGFQQQLPQMSAMTRVSELPPQIQDELKNLDNYIQSQVAIAEFLKAQQTDHKELIESIPRDIAFLEKSYASTTQALTSDWKFVEKFKRETLESFNDWVEKLIKVYLQLTNPMSNSRNDNGQDQGSMKVIIGVSGNRTESELSQQQQQQQSLQKSQNSKKVSSINVTSTLNSYFVDRIEEFKENISKYELILQEVENCVNDLDTSSKPQNTGIEMVISTLQEEFRLYVELANEFAEIHHSVSHLANDKEKF